MVFAGSDDARLSKGLDWITNFTDNSCPVVFVHNERALQDTKRGGIITHNDALSTMAHRRGVQTEVCRKTTMDAQVKPPTLVEDKLLYRLQIGQCLFLADLQSKITKR